MRICFALDLKIKGKTAYQIVACPTVTVKLFNLDASVGESLDGETVMNTYNFDGF